MDLSLGFLFCSIDLYVCLCASTILSWWLWLCSRAWSQAGWFLQFYSSFSRLLWLFKVFCIPIQIVKFFVYSRFLYLHTNCEIICSSSVKNTVGSLIGIAWIYRLLWVVYSFSLYWFFWSMNMVYFSIYLCPLWFLSSVFYSFLYTGLLFLLIDISLSVLFFSLQWWIELFP